MRAHATPLLGIGLALAACGSPAPSPAPQAATAATRPPSGTVAALNPTAPIDAARATAAVATAAVVARTNPGDDAKPGANALPTARTAARDAASVLSPSPVQYDPQGRRDPFQSLEQKVGSERSTVSSARLTGVITSGGVAYALVETSDGIGYILKAGDTLAEGRLVEIGTNMVVFSVAPKPGAQSNRVVLKLPE